MFGGFGRKAAESQAAQQPEPEPEGLARMVADEDMAAEAASLDQAMAALAVGGGGAPGAAAGLGAVPAAAASSPLRSVPLNWARNTGGHKASADTLRLLCEAGGAEGVQAFTNSFYTKAFADPVLDRLIREHDDPHGARFAAWITEKFGDGTPWTDERRTRKTCPFATHGGHTLQSPHDRSSAHFAAWHSPKREPEKFGEHFKLDDCRVWMRLHFWAMRETGIVEQSPSFAEYYVKFIAHFVSVPFARESLRWSEDPSNIERYIANGNHMEGVIGVFGRQALAVLPAAERDSDGNWPYC